jgi:S-methylmethionine-dependent homocysteine/selenocysteine methylase
MSSIDIAAHKLVSSNPCNGKVLAILFNCSEPEAITLALARIQSDSPLVQQLKGANTVLGAYANRLTPVDPTWTLADSNAAQPFRKDLNESQYWNDFVRIWIDQLGVQVVGGCCGITPEHIALIRNELNKRRQQ